MRVLVIGGGGREHALGWKIAQSPHLEKLFFAPGNPGTAALGTNVNLQGNDAVAAFARDERIDLVVVGPEQPLVKGLTDALAEAGIACFGPSAACARIEGSKAFAKQVMTATGVPTASYRRFSDYDAALAHVGSQTFPLVVKADGLAAGKGVTICHHLTEAEKALDEAMRGGRFGHAGETVVIEEFLKGVEASCHVITDGERCLSLVVSKDHKAWGEGDTGPNTGGMGTFAPNPRITPDLAALIQTRVYEPVLAYFRERGTPYRGVLYAGLMLTETGPKVLEFNVRFGDPETQVIMPLLDADLLPVLAGAARGRLPTEGIYPVKTGAAVCVVLAAAGYPGKVRSGDAIGSWKTLPGTQVFHAGTKRREDGVLTTSGGRVLGVTAWDPNPSQARAKAYQLAATIPFEGKYYRKDIGGIHDFC